MQVFPKVRLGHLADFLSHSGQSVILIPVIGGSAQKRNMSNIALVPLGIACYADILWSYLMVHKSKLLVGHSSY